MLGGVPRRGIFHNMKTAVDRIGTGKSRQVNARFAALASHYLFETNFCNPASGWEKGQVEKNVQDARRRLWQPMPSFPDFDALNVWLEEQCVAQWEEIQHGVLPGTVADVHAAEVASLMPMGRPFDGFVEQTKRVSPTCLIAFERNRYSVPASFANRPVSLRVYPDRLAVAAEGNILCEHARIIDRSHHKPGRTIRSMTGGTIWPLFSANQAHCVMAPHSSRCPKRSGSCRDICSSGSAVTGRWSRLCHWSCTMTNKLCCRP